MRKTITKIHPILNKTDKRARQTILFQGFENKLIGYLISRYNECGRGELPLPHYG